MGKEIAKSLKERIEKIAYDTLEKGGEAFGNSWAAYKEFMWQAGKEILKDYPEAIEWLNKTLQGGRGCLGGFSEIGRELDRKPDTIKSWIKAVVEIGKTKKEFDEYVEEKKPQIINNWSKKLISKQETLEKQETPNLPEDKYSVIYADPPWPVESMVLDKWESPLGDKYSTMTIDDICDLKVSDLSSDNCALFIWTTHTFLRETFQVIDAWGFKYHACITWDKVGGWTLCGIHRRTEFCLYAYKGKMNIDQEGKAIETIFQEAKGKHSQKPEWMRKEIDRKIHGKKLELFAREKHDGWDVWGNQV